MIDEVSGAILRASRPGELGDFAQVCRVFGPDRQPLRRSDTTARPGRLSLSAPCPDPHDLPLRQGRWLFCGIGFLHFGHALIFSTSRLWALDHVRGPIDGILYFDRHTGRETRSGTSQNLQAILTLLGIDLPVVTVARDERVEQLIVAEEGISTSAKRFLGTDRYRAFIRKRLGPASDTRPVTSVYVSRVKLGHAKPGLLFEDRIESLMAAAGYRIFHPERASLADQVAVYQTAARIVAVDGSALHLAAFAAPAAARVAILARRPFFAEALARQFQAVSGASALALRPAARVFRPPGHVEVSDAWTASFTLPDFPALQSALVHQGFIAVPETPWTNPTDTDLQTRLDLIQRRCGCTLAPAPATAPD